MMIAGNPFSNQPLRQFSEPIKFNNNIYPDNRGSFQVACKFNEYFDDLGGFDSTQLNISKSRERVFRGLHWQVHQPQAKYIFCIDGEIIDFVVDIRKDSPNFGVACNYFLDHSTSLFVPVGYAHGFLVLSHTATVGYLVDGIYNKDNERSLNIFDPKIGCTAHFSYNNLIMSEKDRNAPNLDQISEEDLF